MPPSAGLPAGGRRLLGAVVRALPHGRARARACRRRQRRPPHRRQGEHRRGHRAGRPIRHPFDSDDGCFPPWQGSGADDRGHAGRPNRGFRPQRDREVHRAERYRPGVGRVALLSHSWCDRIGRMHRPRAAPLRTLPPGSPPSSSSAIHSVPPRRLPRSIGPADPTRRPRRRSKRYASAIHGEIASRMRAFEPRDIDETTPGVPGERRYAHAVDELIGRLRRISPSGGDRARR